MKAIAITVPESLLAAIDDVVALERAAHRGRGYSRADAARELLYAELRRREPPPPNEAA